MLTYTTGNLLLAKVEALVNTVNTVGVMGKGIALEFKRAFPENFRLYTDACKANKVRTGTMFVTAAGSLFGPKWIINFPTKQHWRNPSRLEWIESGLRDLRLVIERERIASIAIPPLGCGNGRLDWGVVKGLIEESLADLAGVDVFVYEPKSSFSIAQARPS